MYLQQAKPHARELEAVTVWDDELEFFRLVRLLIRVYVWSCGRLTPHDIVWLGPYAREASVWEACCWYSGVTNMSCTVPSQFIYGCETVAMPTNRFRWEYYLLPRLSSEETRNGTREWEEKGMYDIVQHRVAA